MSAASSAETLAVLCADPDRLRRDWEALLATHEHLHAPEAARLLGVPEAALVASRIGSGATRLQPDIDRLLAPVSEWGRVLCAFSNGAGVHMPLGAVCAESPDENFRLHSEALDARIDRRAVAHAFLFEDEDDSHGRTRSVQLFDAAGRSILKLFIFHKSRFGAAREHLDGLAHESQSRQFERSAEVQTAFDPQALSSAADPDATDLPDPARSLIADLFETAGTFDVEMVGAHAWIRWSGQVGGVRIDDAMFHLHETEVRSHLRFASIQSASRTRSGALALNGATRRLLRLARKDAS